MGEYIYKQKIARMTLSTYHRIRHSFKALDQYETMSNYFLRLAKYLEDLKSETYKVE